MFHIVTIRTEVREAAAVDAACRRLCLPQPVHATVPLFSGARTGYVFRLPDWRYPVVCDLARGTLAYDDYEGRWGEEPRPFDLDEFDRRGWSQDPSFFSLKEVTLERAD